MRASASFGPMKGVTRFGGTAGQSSTGQAGRPMTRHESAEATTAQASNAVDEVCCQHLHSQECSWLQCDDKHEGLAILQLVCLMLLHKQQALAHARQ